MIPLGPIFHFTSFVTSQIGARVNDLKAFSATPKNKFKTRLT